MGVLDDMAADIDGSHAFYDTDSGFAQDATVNGSSTIQVLLDTDFNPYEEDRITVRGNNLVATCRTSEKPTTNDKLTISSANYRVLGVEDTTDGESILTLVKL